MFVSKILICMSIICGLFLSNYSIPRLKPSYISIVPRIISSKTSQNYCMSQWQWHIALRIFSSVENIIIVIYIWHCWMYLFCSIISFFIIRCGFRRINPFFWMNKLGKVCVDICVGFHGYLLTRSNRNMT